MTTATYYDDRDRRAVYDVLAGYRQLVVDRVREGWHPYLATLMFAQLPGKPAAVIAQMMAEAEFAYKKFLTRAVRRPLSSGSRGRLPIMIAVPDSPVGKRDKPLVDVVINGGLHVHGVLLVPPVSRLPIPADEHFRQQQALYVGDRSHFRAIDVRPIDRDLPRVVDYIMKSISRRRFTTHDVLDDVLVLPRATAELRIAIKASSPASPARVTDRHR
jgi:hypothetical protein